MTRIAMSSAAFALLLSTFSTSEMERREDEATARWGYSSEAIRNVRAGLNSAAVEGGRVAFSIPRECVEILATGSAIGWGILDAAGGFANADALAELGRVFFRELNPRD